jgi:ribonuclease P protein component
MRALQTDEPLSRFGLTTSKAIGNAVTRNRVRRRMREAIGSLGIESGWDIVFNSRVSIAGASYAQIRETMRMLLERADLLEAA